MIAEYTIPNSNMDPNTSILIGNTCTWGMDLSGSMQGAGGVGGLLAVTENGSSSTAHFYPTYDGNGNVSEYLDANGSAVAHYEYDTFGNEIVSATTGSLAQNFEYRFSTKYLDEESGFYYYGYRYCDPVTGRWPSRDPLEENWPTNEFNMYAFILNEPIYTFDILGLSAGSMLDAVLNFLLGQYGSGNTEEAGEAVEERYKEIMDEYLEDIEDAMNDDQPDPPSPARRKPWCTYDCPLKGKGDGYCVYGTCELVNESFTHDGPGGKCPKTIPGFTQESYIDHNGCEKCDDPWQDFVR